MSKKLPKDVAIRVSTSIKKEEEVTTTTFKNSLTGSATSVSMSGGGPLTTTNTATKMPVTVSPLTVPGYSPQEKDYQWNITQEVIDMLQELVEVRKTDGYQQGKIDTYKHLLLKFDSCFTVTDLYKAINDIREELINLEIK